MLWAVRGVLAAVEAAPGPGRARRLRAVGAGDGFWFAFHGVAVLGAVIVAVLGTGGARRTRAVGAGDAYRAAIYGVARGLTVSQAVVLSSFWVLYWYTCTVVALVSYGVAVGLTVSLSRVFSLERPEHLHAAPVMAIVRWPTRTMTCRIGKFPLRKWPFACPLHTFVSLLETLRLTVRRVVVWSSVWGQYCPAGSVCAFVSWRTHSGPRSWPSHLALCIFPSRKAPTRNSLYRSLPLRNRKLADDTRPGRFPSHLALVHQGSPGQVLSSQLPFTQS